jgi:hypothetical protein
MSMRSIESLYFPTDNSFITAPEPSKYSSFKYIFTNQDGGPNINFTVSASLYALNYLSCLRDHILSQSEEKMSGYVKLGTVILLSATATFGFTLLNLAEAVTRTGLAIILFPTIIFLPIKFLNIKYWDSIKFLPNALIVFALSALYNAVIVTAGALAGYEMLTNYKDNHMRDVTCIANDASFGIAHRVADFLSIGGKKKTAPPKTNRRNLPTTFSELST